ncbi:uncharacterized protein THITE_2107870 [Thermothielavioides terrestris NRRL 8126]|uniref:tRNA-intron lyase n=1 Tax=Thermothielavioides terrestris (strain ATCC 38088 / NRRL 8126) TaxID=578455 RepID=G2QVP2_THETT|nr:uncharacterized protein THITE_2107870 [Thermothielavioides terrestris NRRL 8126]AEO63023.1 hypothetical protein THITE_2107870 [Thermothielavioides terrestris NRRL 8126]
MAEPTTVAAFSAGRDAAPDSAPIAAVASASSGRASPPKPSLNQIYALPAPIRTFPLPAFYPNNPISLLHLAYAWLSQVFRPPPREPSVIHVGVWDPETRSVHVRDPTSIRALWEQGFYGKGSLSRSEPNWLKRELARRGSPEGKTVSEARTEQRREERRLAKWERAKAELEAIEKQRLAEAASHAAAAELSKVNGLGLEPADATASLGVPDSAAPPVGTPNSTDTIAEAIAQRAVAGEDVTVFQLNRTVTSCGDQPKAPVSPAELLALPNSSARPIRPIPARPPQWKPPVGPAELLLLPNSLTDLVAQAVKPNATPLRREHQPAVPATAVNGHAGQKSDSHGEVNGASDNYGRSAQASASAGDRMARKVSRNQTQPNGTIDAAVSPPSSESLEDALGETKEPKASKRRKSVRFSPTVESTTFVHSDPPSPYRSASLSSKSGTAALPNGEATSKPVTSLAAPPAAQPVSESPPELGLDAPVSATEIENKEHFQLAPEEAFFLVFSLGALRVVDPVTSSPISTEHLLSLFRAYSHFPPRPLGSCLGPDDPFLVNYAVYHHFRSLGWVPRHGIKFGVDWILYQRGPVFDHSEFGIMVMPTFSDPSWEDHEHNAPRRSWSWLMGVNRVLSHVLKSLVLVYVDIPSPPVFDEQMRRGGIAAALKKYTIREIMVRRFSVNRNR